MTHKMFRAATVQEDFCLSKFHQASAELMAPADVISAKSACEFVCSLYIVCVVCILCV